MPITRIRERDGRIVPFDEDRITKIIWNAARMVGGRDYERAKWLTKEVVKMLNEFQDKEPNKIFTIDFVEDVIEKVLVENGHYKTAKALILLRERQKKLRDIRQMFFDVDRIINGYIAQHDWRVQENANIGYSFSGLYMHCAGNVIIWHVLNNVYPKEISLAHIEGDFHLHNLTMGIVGYCAGWSLRQLLIEGFNGVTGKIESGPAKHFSTALGQLVNFLGTLQNEWAGAQAVSSFDTYLAPFVAYDRLSYKEVKQRLQEFIYSLNVSSRWGGQTPFTNITLDWTVPEDLKDEPVIIGGKPQKDCYGDFQEEMDMINRALLELYLEGDFKSRVFTFPIPTYNITRDFDWENGNVDLLFEMTAKFGLPYFQNFINSDLSPRDVRAMCCHLQLDLRELRKKTGALFGAGEMTGSVGVVTINLPRIGYLSKDEDEFFENLERLMYLAKESLEIKRRVVQRNIDEGLLPYTRRYLGTLEHHFSTIGLVGMNEACLNLFGESIASKTGHKFAIKVLKFMRDKLKEYQEETGHLFNLEATPAEGTCYRLARIDKQKFRDIKTAGKQEPYYTNSTWLPVSYTDDIAFIVKHQEPLQTLYTGGTVLHLFLGENIGGEAAKALVKKIFTKSRIPYLTLTPTFSICPNHGYIAGEHFTCPTCKAPCEVYSRVVGYYRPVQNWNKGKREEFRERRYLNVKSYLAAA